MPYIEKLKEWEKDQVENHGLVHINIFPSENAANYSLEQLCESLYIILTSRDAVDITDEIL